MKLILCFVLLFAASAHAELETYYDLETVDIFLNADLDDKALSRVIAKASEKSFHPLGYKKGAKPALFGYIDLQKDEEGYFIEDVYCQKKIRRRVGPNRIPNNNVMNTEHTWPQSKGAKSEPFRGDLHHLFPTDSKANSIRGNSIFGEVSGKDAYFGCKASQVGRLVDPYTKKETGVRGYQPPVEHRGNVARALFYSAVFYGKHISDMEEFYLKKWHKEDPVDDAERSRNDAIEFSQGNRNPFVDYPELASKILDF